MKAYAVNERLQVAAVQMKWSIEDYSSAEAFARRIKALLEDVRSNTDKTIPTIVVFPEDIGTPLIFTGHNVEHLLSIKNAVNLAVRSNIGAVLWNRIWYRVSWVRGLALAKANAAVKIYVDTFSEMAEEYQVYIVAGSICIPDYDIVHGRLGKRSKGNYGNIYNISYFFGPDGKIIGTQKKSYLTEMECSDGLDLVPGKLEEMEVFDTDIGKIAIAICYDAFKEEVIQKLLREGGEILIQPSANPSLWNKVQQEDWLNSSWKHTYQDKLFKCAINSMMVGDLFDLKCEGQSSIITKSELSSQKGYMSSDIYAGFQRVARTKDDEEVLVTIVEL